MYSWGSLNLNEIFERYVDILLSGCSVKLPHDSTNIPTHEDSAEREDLETFICNSQLQIYFYRVKSRSV